MSQRWVGVFTLAFVPYVNADGCIGGKFKYEPPDAGAPIRGRKADRDPPPLPQLITPGPPPSEPFTPLDSGNELNSILYEIE